MNWALEALGSLSCYFLWCKIKWVATESHPSVVTLASEVNSFGCHTCLRERLGTKPGAFAFPSYMFSITFFTSGGVK